MCLPKFLLGALLFVCPVSAAMAQTARAVTIATVLPDTWTLVSVDQQPVTDVAGRNLGKLVAVLVNNHVVSAYVIALNDVDRKIAIGVGSFKQEPSTHPFFGSFQSQPMQLELDKGLAEKLPSFVSPF
jgi:hypothetical protein